MAWEQENWESCVGFGLFLWTLSLFLVVNLALKPKRKPSVKPYQDSILDRIGYFGWFSASLWAFSHLLSSPAPKGFTLGVCTYGLGQTILSTGHFSSSLLPLQFLGQILAASGYYLFAATYFLNPFTIPSLPSFPPFCFPPPLEYEGWEMDDIFLLIVLSSVVFICFFISIFLYVIPRGYVEVEDMCDMYYVPASLCAYGAFGMILWESYSPDSIFYSVHHSCLLGLGAMTMGGVNMAFPALFPKKYYKIVSRLTDALTYVPWFYVAAEQLDQVLCS